MKVLQKISVTPELIVRFSLQFLAYFICLLFPKYVTEVISVSFFAKETFFFPKVPSFL